MFPSEALPRHHPPLRVPLGVTDTDTPCTNAPVTWIATARTKGRLRRTLCQLPDRISRQTRGGQDHSPRPSPSGTAYSR